MLNELFEYKDGKLFWKNSKGGVSAGSEAGGINKGTGYWSIRVNGKLCKRSRLIFLMFNGFLPPMVDHKDTDKLNDKEDNLRESNSSLNTTNTKTRFGENKYKGAYKRKGERWQAVIGRKYLGSFATEKEAAEAYNVAAKEAYGDHAVLNVI
jgi:hypothetical protein